MRGFTLVGTACATERLFIVAAPPPQTAAALKFPGSRAEIAFDTPAAAPAGRAAPPGMMDRSAFLEALRESAPPPAGPAERPAWLTQRAAPAAALASLPFLPGVALACAIVAVFFAYFKQERAAGSRFRNKMNLFRELRAPLTSTYGRHAPPQMAALGAEPEEPALPVLPASTPRAPPPRAALADVPEETEETVSAALQS